jgi:hypothetical protein
MFHVSLPYPFRVCLLYHVPCMPTISFTSLFTVSCSIICMPAISFQSLFSVPCSMCAYHIFSMFHVCLLYHLLVCVQYRVVRFFIFIFVPYFTILHNTISILHLHGFYYSIFFYLHFEIDAVWPPFLFKGRCPFCSPGK